MRRRDLLERMNGAVNAIFPTDNIEEEMKQDYDLDLIMMQKNLEQGGKHRAKIIERQKKWGGTNKRRF